MSIKSEMKVDIYKEEETGPRDIEYNESDELMTRIGDAEKAMDSIIAPNHVPSLELAYEKRVDYNPLTSLEEDAAWIEQELHKKKDKYEYGEEKEEEEEEKMEEEQMDSKRIGPKLVIPSPRLHERDYYSTHDGSALIEVDSPGNTSTTTRFKNKLRGSAKRKFRESSVAKQHVRSPSSPKTSTTIRKRKLKRQTRHTMSSQHARPKTKRIMRRSMSQPKRTKARATNDSFLSLVSHPSTVVHTVTQSSSDHLCKTPVDYALSEAYLREDASVPKAKRKKRKKKAPFRPLSSLDVLLKAHKRSSYTSQFKHTSLGFHSFPNAVIARIFEYCDFLGVAPRVKASAFEHSRDTHEIIMKEPQQALLYPKFYKTFEKQVYAAIGLTSRASPTTIYNTKKPVQVQLVDYYSWTYGYDEAIAHRLVRLFFGKRHGDILPIIHHLNLTGVLFPDRRLVQQSSKFALPRYHLHQDAGYPHRVFWKSLPIYHHLSSLRVPVVVQQSSLRFLSQLNVSKHTAIHLHINNHGHSMLFDSDMNEQPDTRFAEQFLWHPKTRDDAILESLPDTGRIRSFQLDWAMATPALSKLCMRPSFLNQLHKLILPNCILPVHFVSMLEKAAPTVLSFVSLSFHRVEEYAFFRSLNHLPSIKHVKLMLHHLIQPPPIPLILAPQHIESLKLVRNMDPSPLLDAATTSYRAMEAPFQFASDELAQAFFESVRARSHLKRLSLYQVYFHRGNVALLLDCLLASRHIDRLFLDVHLAAVPANLMRFLFHPSLTALHLHVSTKDYLNWAELDPEGASFLMQSPPALSLYSLFEVITKRSSRRQAALRHLSLAWESETGLRTPPLTHCHRALPRLTQLQRTLSPEDQLDERASTCACVVFQS